MNIKTISGPTIQAALAEARRTLGEDVVLLESIAAEGERPAAIRVMIDDRLSRSAVAVREAPIALGYGYGARTSGHGERSSAMGSSVTATGARANAADVATQVAGVAEDVEQPLVSRSVDPGQRPGSGTDSMFAGRSARNTVFRSAGPTTGAEAELIRQLAGMQSRLADLEQAVRTSASGAEGWKSIEALRLLADRGLHPETLENIFDRLVRTHTRTESVDWMIRNELRRLLEMPVFRPSAAAFIMIGAAGAGKTSLLLKLARHPEYLARRRVCVIAIEPEDASVTAYQSPTDLYRKHGIPVQSVHSREEMGAALQRAACFEPILVDTPSLPLDPRRARAAASRLEEITKDLVPLHVQLVLNATRELDEDTLAFFKKLNPRPNSVALTHLDETTRWGRAAEWLIRLGLPYGYCADGTGVPDGISTLSASRIAERLTTK